MTQVNLVRRAFLSAVCSAGSILTANLLCGEEPISRDDLKEPLLRVSKKIGDPPAAGKGHPLDAAIDIANEALKNIQEKNCQTIMQAKVSSARKVLSLKTFKRLRESLSF